MLRLSPLPRTLEAARRDVKHRRFDVRLSAVQDLGRLAHGEGRDRDEAVRLLRDALGGDEAPGIRAEAAVSLADAHARQALADLVTRTADDEVRVRQMSVLALGELGSKDDVGLVAVIRERLRDSAPAVRFQALHALFSLDVDWQSSALEATRDEDTEVRVLALRLAENLDFGSDHTKIEATPAADFVRRAQELLADEHPRVRVAAALALGERAGEVGLRVVSEALNAARFAGTPEEEALAVERAGEIGVLAARPGLERRAWGVLGLANSACTFQARVALGRLGDPRAKRFIRKGFSALTRDARNLAVTAAGLARLVEARPALKQLLLGSDRVDQATVIEALRLIDVTSCSKR